MSERTFACHESGATKTAVCAGFLLKGAEHNLSVRLGRLSGSIGADVSAEGAELFESYRSMAVANGVAADDECLVRCRD